MMSQQPYIHKRSRSDDDNDYDYKYIYKLCKMYFLYTVVEILFNCRFVCTVNEHPKTGRCKKLQRTIFFRNIGLYLI